MFRTLAVITAAFAFSATIAAAQAPPNYPGQAQFRDLYKELIEVDTTQQHGSCTVAAQAMAARLKAAGYPDADVRILVPADRAKDRNLIAVLHGSDAKAKAVVLLTHIDVA